jgi:hypothetical protein
LRSLIHTPPAPLASMPHPSRPLLCRFLCPSVGDYVNGTLQHLLVTPEIETLSGSFFNQVLQCRSEGRRLGPAFFSICDVCVCVCVFCLQHGERIKGATWLAQDPNNTDLILTGGLLSHRAPSHKASLLLHPFFFSWNRTEAGKLANKALGYVPSLARCTSLMVPLTLAYHVFVFVFVQVQEETHLVERFLVPGKGGASDTTIFPFLTPVSPLFLCGVRLCVVRGREAARQGGAGIGPLRGRGDGRARWRGGVVEQRGAGVTCVDYLCTPTREHTPVSSLPPL